MSSRAMLREQLAALLPATILVTDNAGNLTALDAEKTGGVQVVRAGWASIPYEGQMVANWELWLYVSSTDPETVEDDLEQLWADVFPILDATGWIDWTAAEITPHPDGPQAVRVTAQTITNTTS